MKCTRDLQTRATASSFVEKVGNRIWLRQVQENWVRVNRIFANELGTFFWYILLRQYLQHNLDLDTVPTYVFQISWKSLENLFEIMHIFAHQENPFHLDCALLPTSFCKFIKNFIRKNPLPSLSTRSEQSGFFLRIRSAARLSHDSCTSAQVEIKALLGWPQFWKIKPNP